MIFWIYFSYFVYHSWVIPMMKITGLSHLFKWENLHNWWLTKYFFAPLYVICINVCIITISREIINIIVWPYLVCSSAVKMCQDELSPNMSLRLLWRKNSAFCLLVFQVHGSLGKLLRDTMEPALLLVCLWMAISLKAVLPMSWESPR